MFKIFVSAVAPLLVSSLAIAQAPTSQAYTQGLADRQSWEQWFGSLSGDSRAGAEYWASQRSEPHPGSCLAPDGKSLGVWSTGCVTAKQRLAQTDVRRKKEPDYRLGWNSLSQTTAELPQPTSSVPAGSALPSVSADPPPSPAAMPPARGSSPLVSAGPLTIELIDFLVDGRDYVGQRVTITGCQFADADTDTVWCKTRGGHITAHSPTMERESLRYALRNCAALGFESKQECMGDITGTVTLHNVYGLLITDAAIKWYASPSLPASSSVASSRPPEPTSNAELESRLIQTVQEGRARYASGTTEVQQGAARPMRAQAICKVLPSSKSVINWIGTVRRLSTNTDGKGILVIEIAPDIDILTWNNALSDIFDNTLIDSRTAVFNTMLTLQPGQKVRFNGSFLPSDVDCVKESSVTMHGSIRHPEFLFHFLSVLPMNDAE
jgi:hypothetical protein